MGSRTRQLSRMLSTSIRRLTAGPASSARGGAMARAAASASPMVASEHAICVLLDLMRDLLVGQLSVFFPRREDFTQLDAASVSSAVG